MNARDFELAVKVYEGARTGRDLCEHLAPRMRTMGVLTTLLWLAQKEEVAGKGRALLRALGDALGDPRLGLLAGPTSLNAGRNELLGLSNEQLQDLSIRLYALAEALRLVAKARKKDH